MTAGAPSLTPHHSRPLTPILFAAALLGACAPPARPAPDVPLAGKRAESKRGVVVASHVDAAAAGVEMLRQGGNAIDAAVATSFALGVVDPSQTGLGGYGVGVVWLAGPRRAEVLEAMSQAGADSAWGLPDRLAGAAPAPAAPGAPGATPNASGPRVSFDGGDARSPRTALVPGFVSGLLALHERHGKLPRAAVLAPAARLARDGFVIGALNHRLIAASRDKLAADPEAAALFLPGGQPLPVGARLVQPKLAELLDALARDGARAFYDGPFAARVAAKVRAVGGLLDSADFAAYRPEFRQPICSGFRGHTVLGAPPPVSGTTIAEVLNLAERADLPRYGDPTRDAGATVRLADAIRVALADRDQVRGHPDWARGPARGVASAAYAATRAPLVGAAVRDSLAAGDARSYETAALPGACARIDAYPATTAAADPRTGDARTAGADPSTTGSETSHLVAIDGAGNAVSLTSSVGVLFGSGIYAEGIFLNSSGNLFSAGQRAPRRKPASALSPTILLRDGRVRAAAGAGGAAYIPTAVAQVVYRLAGLGQDPWLALAAPRLHPTADGPALEIEQGFTLDAYAALRAHGYVPSNRVANLQFAGIHAAIVRDDGTIVGAADPRRDGAAIGF